MAVVIGAPAIGRPRPEESKVPESQTHSARTPATSARGHQSVNRIAWTAQPGPELHAPRSQRGLPLFSAPTSHVHEKHGRIRRLIQAARNAIPGSHRHAARSASIGGLPA